MALADILSEAVPTGQATVPDALLGCWRRNWIQFGPHAPVERQVRVIWLQTRSGMADLRIDPAQAAHETDSSCGITVVEPTTPHVTADWHDGAFGFAQQPVPSFPEKGWLTWQSPSIMIETAPSGAYTEEWERLAHCSGHIAHLRDSEAPTSTNLYVAGVHAVLCVKSPDPGGLHEFSWARRQPTSGRYVVELSTAPHCIGEPLNLDRAWHIESYHHRADPNQT